MYSEKEIQQLFDKIRNKSYSECLSSKLMIKNMKVMGYSSPFNGNIYINLNLINKHKLSKNAIIGLLAHELSHQVSYNKRSFISKWLFLSNYYLSINKRTKVEHEADTITIKRGYGKELLEERESQEKRNKDDVEKLELINQIYLSPKEIKQLIEK